MLKYWRESRGLSQLDLSLAADVSSKHISFLETGRAKPSQEMLLTLAATLQIPLREQNTLLQAAGFESLFEETTLEDSACVVYDVIDRMLTKHEPYPMFVMDSGYKLLRCNSAGIKLISHFIAEPDALPGEPNIYEALFDPKLTRPFVDNWEELARALLLRVYRETLLNQHDKKMKSLLDRILAFPDIPSTWRVPDLTQASQPVLPITLSKDGQTFAFTTTITRFSAPQNITAEELKIECLFPLDSKTEQYCETL